MSSNQWGWQLMVILALCGLLIQGSSAIYCVQCKTHPNNVPLEVEERLECMYGHITPQKCPQGSVACRIFVGKMPGLPPSENMVVRDCAFQEMPPMCYQMPAGNGKEHQFCLSTCKHHRCTPFESGLNLNRPRRWY